MHKMKNYMEDVISSATDNVIREMGICNCDKCRADIMALALNELPPKYVVTEIGELYAKVRELEQQFAVDVQAAVIKAALVVKQNPMH